MTVDSPTALVGVSIPVPEPYGSQLREARASFGDPQAATVPSHVTLIPPLPLATDEVECFASRLEQAASAVPRYPMQLRGTGTFRPVSKVVFVAVSQGISVTEVLAQRVRATLGSTIDDPLFPFHPHVTVAQELDDEALDRAYDELADFSCAFTVDRFGLYALDETVGWAPVRWFTLAE